MRLEVIARLHELKEKTTLLVNNLYQLKLATSQIRKSQSLKIILKCILVIGNQLNQSNSMLEKANGFRLNILAELDQTKVNSKDNSELSVLNILAYICSLKFKNDWFKTFRSELDAVENASNGIFLFATFL